LSQSDESDYPLRGKPVNYIDPTEPVAVDEWEVSNFCRNPAFLKIRIS